MTGEPVIEKMTPGFDRWEDLLLLILSAFDGMNGRIDPPSSALALTVESLKEKARRETTILASIDGHLVGCAFLSQRPDCLYLGKLAVAPGFQRRGIGRALTAAAEDHARSLNKPTVELQTRVELTENHGAFLKLGFREVGRTAHPGFEHPTSVTFRKELA